MLLWHGQAWMGLLPFGSPAYRSNILAAVCASVRPRPRMRATPAAPSRLPRAPAQLAGTLLYRTTRMLGGSAAGGTAAVALYSFARLQWLYAITGEVFAMNNVLIALMLHAVAAYAHECAPRRRPARAPCRQRRRRSPTTRNALWGAFACGLALTNQHTAVLFIAVVAPWVAWRELRSDGALVRLGLLAAAAAAAMLLCVPGQRCAPRRRPTAAAPAAVTATACGAP